LAQKEAKRLAERAGKISLGEMCEMGVRGLLVYCPDYRCSHSIAISANRSPDTVPTEAPKGRVYSFPLRLVARVHHTLRPVAVLARPLQFWRERGRFIPARHLHAGKQIDIAITAASSRLAHAFVSNGIGIRQPNGI
jgi:hypothetical protein